SVKITTLPLSGVLTLSGVAVTAGDIIAVGDMGDLIFTPDLHAYGTGYASFTFQVIDDGGTANGGVNLDPTPNTMTIDVTAVNDAPAGADQTVSTLEDMDYVFTASDFGFSDSQDSPANALLNVIITAPPTEGVLTLSGIAVTAGQ